MKKLLFALLVFLIGAVSVVLAQNLLKAEADGLFAAITFDTRGVSGQAPDLSVAEIKMSNGVDCYFMTPAHNALELSSLNLIVSLGCVK
jgi:hypothetical protein